MKVVSVILLLAGSFCHTATAGQQLGYNAYEENSIDFCGPECFEKLKPLLDNAVEMKQRCEDYGFQIDLLNEQMVELRGIVELQSKEIEELKSNHNQKGEESTPSTPSISTTPNTSTTPTGCTSTTIGRNATTLPTKCASYEESRILQIQVPGTDPFQVHCHMEQMDEPAWIVILKRSGGQLDFHRNWTSYRNGFGDLADDHFLGLEKLHRLTRSLPYELLVKLTDFRGNERYALYSNLLIGNEQEKYSLKLLGKYSGDAGDAMSYHLGNAFTTYDKDNDGWGQGTVPITTTELGGTAGMPIAI
ncbi:angiopoietin-related protein 7-like [Drosophila subobscura]|uniref:angiopoietin-related protein 7-like n=1 Tax=Drosophila subobscura TaxID=7241 RepID=UPI00155AEBCD|nr:angiopoietin-related protein 7-like [Drosophila subobscura]